MSRKSPIHYILISLTACLVMSSCQHAQQTNERPVITVTIEPLRYFTEQIVDTLYHVVSMVPKNANPEVYDPVPKQMMELHNSFAYIKIGYIGFEQMWMPKIVKNHPKLPIIHSTDHIEAVSEDGQHPLDPASIDPHTWTSPANAKQIVNNIVDGLSKLDTVHAPIFRQNGRQLLAKIDQTEHTIDSLLSHADRAFVIYHPTLTYYAHQFRLEQYALEVHGKEPTPTILKKRIEQIKEKNIRVLFVQKEFDTHHAQQLAAETHIDITTIDPLSYHWHDEMIKIARTLHHE